MTNSLKLHKFDIQINKWLHIYRLSVTGRRIRVIVTFILLISKGTDEQFFGPSVFPEEGLKLKKKLTVSYLLWLVDWLFIGCLNIWERRRCYLVSYKDISACMLAIFEGKSLVLNVLFIRCGFTILKKGRATRQQNNTLSMKQRDNSSSWTNIAIKTILFYVQKL